MVALTHWVCFLCFLRTADVMAPCLSVVFRRLVLLGSFMACWRQANVTPIPKGPPSSSVGNYLPISMTSVLSKVFERLVSVRLWRFMERSGVLPTTQFSCRKGLGTCDALLCTIHCRVHWRVGRRLGSCRLISVKPLMGSTIWVFSISSALWVGIGGSVLSILAQFLSNRSQHVMVDGCRSKLVNVVPGVLQGSVLSPLLFLLYTS